MNDDQWVEVLRDAAREYHEPPDIVPRDAMWAAIEAHRRRPRVFGLARRWAPLAAAAAIVLATGIVLGRWSAVTPASRTIGATGGATPRDTVANGATPEPYRIVATQQLVQAEALLTAFQTGARGQRSDAQLAAWARDVLSNTRLLLDSPAGADPRRRQLLEDLELVLAQIVELSPDAPARDRAMIDRALTDGRVMTRLRAAIPATQVGS